MDTLKHTAFLSFETFLDFVTHYTPLPLALNSNWVYAVFFFVKSLDCQKLTWNCANYEKPAYALTYST